MDMNINCSRGHRLEKTSLILLAYSFCCIAFSFSARAVGELESRIDALQTVRCALDLGEVTFGGVKEACHGAMPDKKRCCPVLAAWVYAADARLALFPPTKSGLNNSAPETDMDITSNCISSLESALQVKEAFFDTGNSSCDPVVCYCGIYLTEIDDDNCPFSDFRNGGESRSSSILRSSLEQNCRIASYKGCTNCVDTLQNSQPASQFTTSPSLNATREEYCKLMGLMWLLYNNRTAYIPTVSSVLRALLYSNNDTHATPECSPNSENMPLATNGIEFVTVESTANRYDIRTVIQLLAAPLTLIILLLTGQYA